MVKKIKKDGRIFYMCEACGFSYTEEEWSKKCEDWCKKHSSCNLEITKHAIG